MPYCTLQQLTDRYSEAMLLGLSDRGALAPEEVDEALFSRAIADADATIDAYLKPRYALPLAAVPAVVTDLSQRIAIYNAHGQVVPEKIRDDYKAALKLLDDIKRGEAQLDIAGVEPAASGAAEVRTNDPHRPMTADTMTGYI